MLDSMDKSNINAVGDVFIRKHLNWSLSMTKPTSKPIMMRFLFAMCVIHVPFDDYPNARRGGQPFPAMSSIAASPIPFSWRQCVLS